MFEFFWLQGHWQNLAPNIIWYHYYCNTRDNLNSHVSHELYWQAWLKDRRQLKLNGLCDHRLNGVKHSIVRWDSQYRSVSISGITGEPNSCLCPKLRFFRDYLAKVAEAVLEGVPVIGPRACWNAPHCERMVNLMLHRMKRNFWPSKVPTCSRWLPSISGNNTEFTAIQIEIIILNCHSTSNIVDIPKTSSILLSFYSTIAILWFQFCHWKTLHFTVGW